MRAYELFEAKQPDGTYAGVRPSKKTAKGIAAFCREHDIPNAVPIEKLHTTLLYSRKYLPDYRATGTYDEPLVGKPSAYDVWESEDDETGETTRCLVLKLECDELVARHEELMNKHGATYDHDEYNPHVTLSYDIGDMEIDDLPMIDLDIIFDEEYQEDLDLNWAKTNDMKESLCV